LRRYEFPFHLSQVIFIHNSEHCPTPPTTLVEFIAWCKGAGAGKFVYSSDYTGTAFVKTVFYHYAGLASAGGTYEDFLVPFDQALFDSVEADVWAELNALEPYVLRYYYSPSTPITRNSSAPPPTHRNPPPLRYLYHPDAAGSYPHSEAAPYYPADHEDVRALVADETIWMDVSYNIAEASAQIQLREANDQDGWPDTMRPFLLSAGSIANTNFMAIPVNAPHAAAALVAVNHIGSPGEMFKRNTPEQWGALQAFDTTTETMKDWDLAFDYVETHHATPTVEALQAARVRELSPEWTTAIEASWNANVANSR
jgi:putative spermidine/putrescine transport system substrate-binding protein